MNRRLTTCKNGFIRIINRFEIRRMAEKIRNRKGCQTVIVFSSNPFQREIELGFQNSGIQLVFGLDKAKIDDPTVLIVPLDTHCLDQLHKRKYTGNALRAIPIPPLEAVHLMNDKLLFINFLRSNSFASYVPAEAAEQCYPCILKKRISEGGRDCFLIPNAKTKMDHLDKISDTRFFLQEYIPGETEYAAHLMVKEGVLMRSMTIKYYFSHAYPIKFKDTPILKYRCRSRYLDVFMSILNLIKFEGLCCVNYKIKEGKPVIFEINPRLGASAAAYLPFFIQDFLTHTQSV